MEIKEKPSNDTMAVVTADPAPVVVAMAVGEGNSNGVNEHESSCVLSNVCSNVNSSSTPSKKAVDKELRQPFPVKVYEMLENAEEKQFSHIVSWNEAGTGFMVHDKDHFTKEIVPHYFNLTKYKSFQRQVSPMSNEMLSFPLLFNDYSQLQLYLLSVILFSNPLHYSCHCTASNE